MNVSVCVVQYDGTLDDGDEVSSDADADATSLVDFSESNV